MHGLPPPRQLRPTCNQTPCNYAQDRLGYVGQQKQVAKTTKTKRTDTNKEPPEARIFLLKGKEGTGCDKPTPTPHTPPPPLPPPHSNTLPNHPIPPRTERTGRPQGETGHGERDKEGKITGQGRPRSPKTLQSAEGGEGKDKRERIIVVVRSPCQENYPADAHPSAHRSGLESATPAWTRSVHLDAPGQRHGQQPVSGIADPRVVKQSSQTGQVIQGLR